MKVNIEQEEVWPKFYPYKSGDNLAYGVEREIPDELYERFLEADKEWCAVQEALEKVYYEG